MTQDLAVCRYNYFQIVYLLESNKEKDIFRLLVHSQEGHNGQG